MATSSMPDSRAMIANRLFENLLSDLRSLSVEAKKKHPPVKEVPGGHVVISG